MRVELDESSGEKHIVLYDGKDIALFNPLQNVYAQTPKVGGIDEAVMYFLIKPIVVAITTSFVAFAVSVGDANARGLAGGGLQGGGGARASSLQSVVETDSVATVLLPVAVFHPMPGVMAP